MLLVPLLSPLLWSHALRSIVVSMAGLVDVDVVIFAVLVCSLALSQGVCVGRGAAATRPEFCASCFLL